jgi:hypothetical protein
MAQRLFSPAREPNRGAARLNKYVERLKPRSLAAARIGPEYWMPPRIPQEYEDLARLCIWLSIQSDSELSEMLLRLARIWVRVGLREEHAVLAGTLRLRRRMRPLVEPE